MRHSPLLVGLLLVGLLLLTGCRFPPPRIEVPQEPSAELIEHGRYLSENVGICTTCHSQRDWRYYGGPPAEGTAGAGGTSFTELFLFPDEVVINGTNLTPAGPIGDWTDAELARAITGGLRPDGSMIFLMMPINQYRYIAKPDLVAMIAYLRSLHPVENDVPPTELKYQLLKDVGWMFVAPPAMQRKQPGAPGSARRGKYIANLASCRWCHTATDILGFPVPGTDWAGGMGFPVPEPGGGWVFSPNITPDEETGIGRWSREQFIARFRASKPEIIQSAPLPPGGFNSPMAWSAYSGMTDEDLGAIYAFLMKKPKKRSSVPRWVPEAPPRKKNGTYDFDAAEESP